MPRDRQLSPRRCGKIEGLKECGLGERNIAKTVGVSRGSVKNCLKRLQAGAISCKKRSRRPRKTRDRDDRFLEETAKRNRRLTSRQLKQEFEESTGQAISRSLVCRRLAEREMHARRPGKKPVDDQKTSSPVNDFATMTSLFWIVLRVCLTPTQLRTFGES